MVKVDCLIFTTNEPVCKFRGLIECSTIEELCTNAVKHHTTNEDFRKKKIDVIASEFIVYEMNVALYTKLLKSTTRTFDEEDGMTLLVNRLTPVEADKFYVLVGPSSSGTYDHSINQFHIPLLFVSAVNHSCIQSVSQFDQPIGRNLINR